MTVAAEIRRFFGLCCAYLVIALAITIVLRGGPAQSLARLVELVIGLDLIIVYAAAWVVPGLVVTALVAGRQALRTRLEAVLWALFAAFLLQVAFFLLKSAIPMINPYHADPALAGLDRWLHGGTDPWVIAHRWAAGLPMGLLLPFYVEIWALPATALPVYIALTDPDLRRSRRFLWLFAGSWVVLGNVVATLGSSVGPVFYDRLIGGDRFAGLTEALRASPVEGSLIGIIQTYLWQNHESGVFAAGSAISAFPSLHVAMAALTALYVAERHRLLAPLGWLFLGLVQFLSVYTGYHYAIDGYVSIVAVVAGWAVLRRIVCRVTIASADGVG